MLMSVMDTRFVERVCNVYDSRTTPMQVLGDDIHKVLQIVTFYLLRFKALPFVPLTYILGFTSGEAK